MKGIKEPIQENLERSKRFLAKRLPFTIIEMLIVISILALVGGVVSISIHRAFVQQRFRSEVAVVVNTLRLAQDLMLIMQDDVHVKFTEEKNKGIKFWIETESPLAESWEKEIQRTHKTLKAIHAVKFRDELLGTVRYGELDIKFLSGGSVMSKGIIRLSSTDDDTQKNALRSAICLYGYPHPINSFPEEQAGNTCLIGKDEAFDDKLTDLTVLAVSTPMGEEDDESEE